MNSRETYEQACKKFIESFEEKPEVASYAPGRVEVLGNHTDYNEGFVLAMAINYGTFFLAARATGDVNRVIAGDIMEEAVVPLNSSLYSKRSSWVDCVFGWSPPGCVLV